MDDTSAISEVRSSINKENKFSSERNESFISDTNSNNINKFIINDINLEQNDKIIKELASELEQSTAKKDKLESKLKSACNNIEPINLLFKKNENKNIEIENNSNNNINNNN
jgi:trans-2-enoyl-CoA reductase